jgi:FtsH-binding integral membrane protein
LQADRPGQHDKSTLERRIWVVAFTAAVVLGASDLLRRHVAHSSILSTICMVLVIGAVIVEVVALFAWVRLRERRRSAPENA